MNSSTDPEKETAHFDPTNDTQPTRSASTVVEKDVLDLEKAAGVQTATSASSIAEHGDRHNEPTPEAQNDTLEAQNDTRALFQEPQIEKWRLISLYVR
jgi:hypothetical protein